MHQKMRLAEGVPDTLSMFQKTKKTNFETSAIGCINGKHWTFNWNWVSKFAGAVPFVLCVAAGCVSIVVENVAILDLYWHAEVVGTA